MNAMDLLLHSYLCKLKIIAKLPENGRFDTSNNDIMIYQASIINWARRKFVGYSKDDTIKYLLALYREIQGFADQIMYNISTEHNGNDKIRKMRMLISLAEKIKESMSGIKNLIDTYQGFHTAVSRLECLEQDIITPLYISLKHFIPSQYHTPVLRASLLSTATTGGDKLPPIYESPSAPEMPLHSMRNIERASQTISSPILTPDSPYHGGEPFMVRSMPVDIPAHLAHSFRPHTN